MKFLQKHLVAAAAFGLVSIIGCASPQGTREDYFGYNNKPVIEEEETPVPAEKPQTKTWQNPLSESPRVATVYYEPVFVPVTAPWWDRYYGWEDYHHSRVIVMYPHQRVRYYDWDYAYYPYHYGYPHYGGYPYYDRPYDRYPVYNDNNSKPVEEKKTSRGFGSSRGTVNPESGKDTRGGNDNGWKVRGRSEGEDVTPVRTGESTSSSSSNSSRSRGPDAGTRSRSSEKKEESSSSTGRKSSQSSTTESNSSKKSGSESSSSKKSESTSTSTSKETTTKAKGRGE